MSRVVVVGSGASGVHFALTAVRKGHDVTMLDVGRTSPPTDPRDITFDALKAELSDPADYFLGPDLTSVTLPGSEGEVYAFPPSKKHVFEAAAEYQARSTGIAPYASFAQGGLAEAWTAGVYPFNDVELEAFPFTYADIAPYYGQVAQRIGINGAADDLAQFFPVHDHLLEPLALDAHSRVLLDAYARNRNYLNKRLACYVGRSRIATLTHALDERATCTYCGRCMWGCPTGAFYTPAVTLQECLRYANFTYEPDAFVSHFECDAARRVTEVVASSNGVERRFALDKLVLAAGTLSSSRIYLDSVYRLTGTLLKLPGLMDNRQILVPYVNLRTVGAPYAEHTYQYHQLAFGMRADNDGGSGYVHGQITTLTTGLVHPIIQSLPVALGPGIAMFRAIRTALGVVNINLSDTRRSENYITIEPLGAGRPSRLVVHYAPAPGETERIRQVVSRTRRALRRLGCVAPARQVQVRPMGASVHYSGTLPMSCARREHAVSPACVSYDFDNLIVADGASFPFLPAKNLTFTLMANATRVANELL